jgi:hypothetical protein
MLKFHAPETQLFLRASIGMAKCEQTGKNAGGSASKRGKSAITSIAMGKVTAEKTSAKVASAAAKILRDPKSDKGDRLAAASALTQWPAAKPKRAATKAILDAVRKHKRSSETAL